MNNNSEELRSVLEYLAKKLVETLSPNFSTTNNDTTFTCKISVVAAFKKYFDNKISRNSLYYIPYIIFEGTTEYYRKIVNKAKKLKKYVFEWYKDRIIWLKVWF